MEKIAHELRALFQETLRELWHLGFPLLASALYFISSPVLSHLYRGAEEDGDSLGSKEAPFWSRVHAFLGTYGACTLVILGVSGALGGWYLTLVTPTFWVTALALYALGAFAFWMCTVAEPGALDRLAHELNLPKAED